VGKKPTRSPGCNARPLRQARYSAMLSIVRIAPSPCLPLPPSLEGAAAVKQKADATRGNLVLGATPTNTIGNLARSASGAAVRSER